MNNLPAPLWRMAQPIYVGPRRRARRHESPLIGTMSKQLFIAVLLALFGGVGLTYVDRLGGRLQDLEEIRTPARITQLKRELAKLRSELEDSQAHIDRYALDRSAASSFAHRLEGVEAEIRSAQDELDAQLKTLTRQSRELRTLEEERERYLVETLGTRWDRLNRDIDARWEDVNKTLEATAKLAVDSHRSVQTLSESFDRGASPEADHERQWAELMGPTVQITDESTVGSGVLLKSRALPDGSGWRTYLLTAWHVVRDILDRPTELDQPIPVHVYREEGGYTPEEARLVVYDPEIDAALLVLSSTRHFEYGAELAARDRLETVKTFDEIYAVGCPLGNDPIPTRGEVADVHHRVDNERYWMISAPTYIGNSGGGIFDARTHELLGLFSKIYTHGNLRPTVIPHMGLATPSTVLYDWLENVGYGHLLPR